MRKAFIIIISLICAVTARPQQADGRVGTLLGSNDWFTLDREYPMLRDSVKTEFLRLMADALLSVYFNRPDEAVAATDSLIKNHQHEIGFDNTHSMVILKAAVEDRRGNSPAAAEIMRSFVSQVKASGAQTDLSTAEALCQWYGKNRQWADSVAVRETRLSGGYSSHGKKEYLRLPGLTFSVGGTDVPVSHVFVLPDEQPVTCPDDGNIGLILIEGCRKATLNTREMFLKIER